MSRSGADLALLLLGGFRSLVDDAVDELALRGHEDVRPVHDFAKQAAAKTIAVLQERGYVARDTDPLDARRKRLQVTDLGFEVLRQGEAIFDELRDRWERQIGPAELERLETHLAALVGASSPIRFDTPGWMTRDLGEPG
jgi:hypothetical protein